MLLRVLCLSLFLGMQGEFSSNRFSLVNNFYYNHSLIKLTSPKLNFFLIVGALSVFLSVILYSYPSTDRHAFDVICPVSFNTINYMNMYVSSDHVLYRYSHFSVLFLDMICV